MNLLSLKKRFRELEINYLQPFPGKIISIYLSFNRVALETEVLKKAFQGKNFKIKILENTSKIALKM